MSVSHAVSPNPNNNEEAQIMAHMEKHKRRPTTERETTMGTTDGGKLDLLAGQDGHGVLRSRQRERFQANRALLHTIAPLPGGHGAEAEDKTRFVR